MDDRLVWKQLLRNPTLFTAIIAWLMASVAAGAGEVRVGVLAYQGSERAAREWEPTIFHLSHALPGRQFTLVPFDLDGMTTAVSQGGVDFIITNPGNYISLEAAFGVTRIATLESRQAGSPTAALGSTVITRRPLSQWGDLKGKTLAVVSTDAFGGFQIAWREMADIGIDPQTDLKAIRVTGFPMERVVAAVRDGSADAGVLRACELEAMIAEGKSAPDEFQVIGEHSDADIACRHSSRHYPDWPFARLAGTPRELAKAVAAALLAMPETEGKAWTAPMDYTTVHELFRTLGIGPYQRSGSPSLADLARRYWHWLAALAAGVLWWIIHVTRVEVLVRRRTTELLHEIAERERAEDAAAHHREERDRYSRLGILGEMASNISHELNQPLAAIANYGHGMVRMLDAPDPNPALLRDGALAVTQQAERAAAIIQRIRAFVRRRPPQRATIDLNALIGETLELFEALSNRRSIAIHCHLAETLAPVLADRVEIQQVLFNLLQNAIDAMASTGGGLTVRSSAADGMAKVAVRDSGPGLSPEAEAGLFEPFFSTKPEGLGLGLSICRTIIESHGGRLWAAANPRRGLTMRFTLPFAEDEGPA